MLISYLLTYLSNENQEAVDVHFDDFAIYHGMSNVAQIDDYYPFGLSFNSYYGGIENKYRYNGKEQQKETGWYDYLARQYDPSIGRFTSVDPAADMMRRYSTYAFDNPIRYIDPDGMMPSETAMRASEKTVNVTSISYEDAGGGKPIPNDLEMSMIPDSDPNSINKFMAENTSLVDLDNPDPEKGKQKKRRGFSISEDPEFPVDEPNEELSEFDVSYRELNRQVTAEMSELMAEGNAAINNLANEINDPALEAGVQANTEEYAPWVVDFLETTDNLSPGLHALIYGAAAGIVSGAIMVAAVLSSPKPITDKQLAGAGGAGFLLGSFVGGRLAYRNQKLNLERKQNNQEP